MPLTAKLWSHEEPDLMAEKNDKRNFWKSSATTIVALLTTLLLPLPATIALLIAVVLVVFRHVL